jgi:hypothetical protein
MENGNVWVVPGWGSIFASPCIYFYSNTCNIPFYSSRAVSFIPETLNELSQPLNALWILRKRQIQPEVWQNGTG